jgi:NitT/TauT family transport system substrate-binding protein
MAACDRSAPPASQKTEPQPPQRTRIRFATDWRAQAEHGGFYQALATGLYARRNLNVEIRQGGPGVNVPQLLAAGAVELGMGSNSFIPLNLVAERAPVRAVAAFFQKDPQVLIAHPDPSLESIADLRGRPILLADASVSAFWVWLKAKYGFTDEMVRKYTFNPAPFIADEQAVQQGYLTSEPFTIEKATGEAPKVFLLADEGYPSYATMVLAPDNFVRDNRSAVQAFILASAEGWRSYLHDDPAPAHRLIRAANPDMPADLLAHARTVLRDQEVVEGGDAVTMGIGAMTEARWREFFEVASSQGVYPPNMDWKKAFRLDLLARPA